jgi:DNA-binding NarL/FixJ family response regulator
VKETRSLSGTRITLAIADANPMAARLLCDQLKRYPEFVVVSCDSDRASLLSSLKQNRAAVALVSTDLQDGLSTGLVAIREIREIDPAVRSIVLCDRPESHLVLEGLRSGARGVFSRCTFDFSALRKCVRRVFEGQLWLGNSELEFVVDALGQSRPLRVVNAQGMNLLSPREEQVMRLAADGLGNREIAEEMNLSEHTVKNYMFHIFDKLGISNRVELVLYAVSNPKAHTPTPLQQEKLPADTVRRGA